MRFCTHLKLALETGFAGRGYYPFEGDNLGGHVDGSYSGITTHDGLQDSMM